MSVGLILFPLWLIGLIAYISLVFYFTLGGVYLVTFGLSTQFIGFFVLLFSQKTVRANRKEFDKLVEEKLNDVPYIQVGHNQWRFFMGWVIVSIGLLTQMVGLFLPETGLWFK